MNTKINNINFKKLEIVMDKEHYDEHVKAYSYLQGNISCKEYFIKLKEIYKDTIKRGENAINNFNKISNINAKTLNETEIEIEIIKEIIKIARDKETEFFKIEVIEDKD